ncbi:DUF2079 domain-containing protein [Actinoplanes couchii]|uniref:DUF2079 domain-containing protein n=1 Tax=Actinoplanes couchii TaxID=403638 RepID=A0ABQ3XHZ8_9ACTN|nr:DUF2079 domain-containing protein [Actinoplanes couchii]MDR6317732.1 putative membrane protein [Actinoplanes couchii]GID58116.1 hypothetical protein Aco03nite_065200 [Actinoplanes couchii]
MLLTVRRTLLSPCGWIVGLAIYFFAPWARAQYEALTVGACDLGIFYQAVQGWAHSGWPMVPIKGYVQLGDHFSPVFALLAPLVWIHDSPITLVYAQVVLICLSGVPIYHIFRRRHGILVGSVMLIAYLCSHAVFGTIQFPVHEVMFGALFLAWGLERMLAGHWTQATILFAAMVTVKEDGGLMAAMLGAYALLNRRWRHGAFLIGWGALWFIVTLKFIIPNLNPGGFTYAKDYQASLHADGIFAGIPYMLSHPGEILGLMVDNEVKLTTWEQLLIPVGFAALASPLVLLIVPIMLSRMLSARDTQWSSTLYYDMPLIPILFAAVADSFRRLGSLVDRVRGLGPAPDPTMAPRKAVPEPPADAEKTDAPEPEPEQETETAVRRRWVPRTATIMAAVAAPVFVWFAVQDVRENPIKLWHQGTAAPFNNASLVAEAPEALAKIPPGVPVRATNNLLIPLLPTNEVTLIGSNVDKGDWAIVDTINPSCPIGKKEVPQVMQQLDQMGFRVVYSTGRVQVLQRTGPAIQPIRGTGTAS